MRKREREFIERAFRLLELSLSESSCVAVLSNCHTNLVTARGLLNKVIKEDDRERARLETKGRKVRSK